MKSFIICAAFVSMVIFANAQDSTRTPVIQDDPPVKQSPQDIKRSSLQDMVTISSTKLPEAIKKAVEGAEFKGSKTYYKHKKKDEYAVEVRDGEVSSLHFFDKDGKSINKRD
ncbi:MAG TPA: hypothetical protein VK666_07460 [Chryseolinea sp.]|nr:hypothetical protein [Chryseolinea sp.]